jgi:putrescine transport system ATP-binding protein
MSGSVVSIRGVSKSFGMVKVLDAVDLEVRRGEFLALLGGSGSGKTTLLRLIAGFEQPDEGVIAIAGKDMAGAPPYARPVNMVFQSYALFPHLTVAGNIAYGLKAGGASRELCAAAVKDALALVRMEGFEARKPDQLSGGQRQRVALARALVKKPDVLLLDEPMAALDRGLREDMQAELVGIQKRVGTTFIIVTHDQDEAMSMADRVAVMDKGTIAQIDSPQTIYDFPASRSVAAFIGRMNLFEGVLSLDEPDRAEMRTDDGLVLKIGHGVPGPAGMRFALALRPEKIALSERPSPEANAFEGVIERTAYFGDMTRADIRLPNGRALQATLVNRSRHEGLALGAGGKVHVGFGDDALIVLSR